VGLLRLIILLVLAVLLAWAILEFGLAGMSSARHALLPIAGG
jgi:hypothetical protein